MSQDSPGATKDSGSGKLPDFDTSVANAARMWNYWIGGKDNFRADRDAGDHVRAAMPELPLVAAIAAPAPPASLPDPLRSEASR